MKILLGQKFIHNAWKQFVKRNKRDLGSDWTVLNIRKKQEDCINSNKKFSEELKSLNKGCPIKLTKPKLGQALAETIKEEDLDDNIKRLLSELNEIM